MVEPLLGVKTIAEFSERMYSYCTADHFLVMFKQVLTAKPLVLTKSCNIHDSTVDEPLMDTPNSYSDIEPLVSHE